MSSSLNSSALQRAAEQTAQTRFDTQGLLLRKTDADANNSDAFAQIFASAQEVQKPRLPVADAKTDDTAPERNLPATPGTRPVHSAKAKDDCKAKDSNDDADAQETSDNQTAKPRVETKQADKKSGTQECKAGDDKKSDDTTADVDADAKAVVDAAQEAPKAAQPTDTIDVTAAETTQAATDQKAATPDASAAAASFCLPVVLKAQEAAATGGTTNDDTQEQEGDAGKTPLADLITFRANSGTGDKKAGKAGNLAAAAAATAGTAVAAANDATKVKSDVKADAKIDANANVKADAEADIKVDVKADIKVDVKADVKAAADTDKTVDFTAQLKKIDVSALPVAKLTAPAPTAPTAPIQTQVQPPVVANDAGDAVKQFTTAVHATSPNKSEASAPSSAPEQTEANNSAPTDVAVSPSPPAAGSRVNALTGFPAPLPPTGSGSGSLPSAKAAVGDGVDGIQGLGAISTSARMDGGAVIQLAKGVKADGTALSSPADQVSVALSRTIKNGSSSFEVQLSPAELGKVSIKLDISKDGVVNAVVTSDNPATHDMLQKDAKQLEKVFQQAGLQTDSGSLSFNLRSDTQQQQAANQGEAQQNWKRWMSNAQNVETAATTQPQFYSAAPGRVDLMI